MKLFICLLALSLVSATICAPANKTKRGTGYGSGYGSSSSYGSAPMTKTFVETIQVPTPAPAPVRTQVVQLEQVETIPAAHSYSAPAPAPVRVQLEQVQTIPAAHSYAAPAPAPVRVQLEQVETTVIPATSSYSAPARTLVRENVITEQVRQLEPEYQRLCLDKKGYASVFYLPHPIRQSWYIQCDEHGQGFLKECPAGTIFTLNLVCENVNDLHVVEEKTLIQPQMDTVVGSYNSAPVFAADANSIETTRVEIIKEAPEFQELCLSKRQRDAYGSSISVFYLPHPSKQSWYIQCDEHGRAFLKDCPAGTIFTLNLACEKIGELHAVEQHSETIMRPQLDTVVKSSSYGSAPATTSYGSSSSSYGSSSSYSAAPAMGLELTGYTETAVPENPEYRELCLSKRTAGVAVFYLPHPTKQSWYIQCDEFGRAFLKDCPAGTIFTLNLACENINDLHAIEQTQTVVQPQLDTVVGSYNSAPVFANDNSLIQTTVTIQEAPEFRDLCMSKRSAGVAVFYLPHPTKQSWYIQCDEFGKAFLKDCPAGTIFTLNLVCENVNDLHAVEHSQVVVQQQQLDAPVTGGYNSAPVFPTESSSVIETSRVEIIKEAPEFRELCLSKRTAGVLVFYLPHPEKRSWYIQCDEFGRAFLKDCPAGTIFTSRLTCEKIGEIQEVETIVERPVLREQTIISQPVLSYGEKHIERPVMQESHSGYGQSNVILREQVIRPVAPVVNSYGSSQVVTVPRPIMREIKTSSYGQATPVLRAAPVPVATSYAAPTRTIFREQVIRPVAPVTSSYGSAQVVQRPIMREIKTSSYGQATPVLRAAPVVSSYGSAQVVQRPVMREVIATSSRSSY